jgi:hypothetical protein
VLRPGGYLLCIVHGDSFIDTQLNDQDRAALKRDGRFTLDAKNPRASYSSQVLGSWDIFQTRDQVREVFSTGFDLLCYTSRPAAAGEGYAGPAEGGWRCLTGGAHLPISNESEV